jgi:hypothetical protein
MRIYLAGKVEKNCWRHDIITRLRRVETSPGHWPILRGAVFGHDYVGPYFVSCDHGCYHGPGQHGMGGRQPQVCVDVQYTRSAIVSSCLAAIDKADLVFAWLPTQDAYGSIFELGYAHAQQKHLVVATPDPKYLPDVWFALTACQVVRGISPRSALGAFLRCCSLFSTTQAAVPSPPA